MKRFIPFSALLVLFLGCSTEEGIPPEEDDLAPTFNKEDTAYYSNLATEMQGVFVSEMSLDLSAMGEAERNTYVERMQAGGWERNSLIGDHIKFAKEQLSTEKLHMNLSAQDVTQAAVALEGTTLKINYALAIETTVSFEELRAAGIEPASLTNRSFPVILPADPRELFARVGESCAEGFDAGTLADYNYFSYFKPGKAGCSLPLSDASFTLNSLLPRKTTYPEYNRLVADGQVTVAVFFGAAEHNETVSSGDEGVREHRELIDALKSRGFSKGEALNPGERWTRTRAGIQEIVDVRSPYDLAALKEDTRGLFRDAMKTHEIVIYDGHSFYGSLNVLSDKDAYPADTYQIVFMNSCWSYEYYVRQVFEHKATAADPKGWALADVVNNTEPAWFTNMGEETRILLTNLFAGCETGGRDGSRQYTWDGIIEAMNKHALDRFKSWGLKSHEIYGVSGVRENCYDPAHPDACNGQVSPQPGGDTERVEFSSAASQAIPDNTPAGVRSILQVPQEVGFTGLEIAIDIEHTWIGDLVIELEHAGKTVTLQSREGDSAHNLVKTFTPSGFAGLSAAGDWTLVVSDRASRDTGTLKGWKLILVRQADTQAPSTYNSTDNGLDIPDDDATGVGSTLTVPEDKTIGSLRVNVDIAHTYVGDLVLELEHDGKTVTLQAQEGGSAQNLVREFAPADFNGQNARGTWTLIVSDRAAADTGKLNSWSLTIGS